MTTEYHFDARNQITKSLTGNVATGFFYDRNGNATRMTDGTGAKDMFHGQFNPAPTRDRRKCVGRTMTSWTDSADCETTAVAGARPWPAIAADGDGGWHRTVTATLIVASRVTWFFASPTATPPGVGASALLSVLAAETQHPAPRTSSTASRDVVPGSGSIVVQRCEYTGHPSSPRTATPATG